jgi:formamidopyrimidine-DNA glycosylase
MPELPDVELYLSCLRPRIAGRVIERVTIARPFVLRSVDPLIGDVEGRRVAGLRRIGKRIVLALDEDLFVVIHLMVAGRLRWFDEGEEGLSPRARLALAALRFDSGTLWLTEAGTRRQASIHVVRGEAALAAHDRGGIEVADADGPAFAERLRRESHTLKRALTDPRLFSGIGGAYADEIMHRARLSPIALTPKLSDDAIARLHDAAVSTLREWTDKLIRDVGAGFPGAGEVTAFRHGMAVHGRFGQPCPDCGAPVQRIVHGDNETNYCPRCQTGGRVLADRSLSRLLRDDWPRTLEELEEGA